MRETHLGDSIDSGNFLLKGYLPLIQKNSVTHMHGFAIYVKEGFSFAWDLSWENSVVSYLCFRLALLHSVSSLFLPFTSFVFVLSFCAISSNRDEVFWLSSCWCRWSSWSFERYSKSRYFKSNLIHLDVFQQLALLPDFKEITSFFCTKRINLLHLKWSLDRLVIFANGFLKLANLLMLTKQKSLVASQKFDSRDIWRIANSSIILIIFKKIENRKIENTKMRKTKLNILNFCISNQ